MSDQILQPDLAALHESAIDIITYARDAIEQGAGLVDRHAKLIDEYQSEHKLDSGVQQSIKGYLKSIDIELEKVKTLELRMAIVAPMKAGKSMILNAVAGQDLLPSRTDAMTVLPTEIVFSDDVNQPKLMLGKTLEMLKIAWRQAHQEIDRIGLTAAKAIALREDLVNDIKQL